MGMGKIEEYLHASRKKKSALIFVLIDSEVSKIRESVTLAKSVEKIGASAILVGGSSATDQIEMAQVVKTLKKSIKIPIILFPGNVTGVVPQADAILFSSLLNSENPYYITQAQALGAPSVLKFGLEPLPTAYIIIGEGTTAWFVGAARAIPFDKAGIAAAYSLAAQFLGMRFVYLEAGSGAKQSVKPEMVRAVRKVFKGFLIVGGGIRDVNTAKEIVAAGADALVIGTMLEREGNSLKRLAEIANSIKNIKK
ncbi:geranylgeranylglyceryl/heptaprenylglyceryl phosphate synthase [Candidatus Nitrosotenuis sp. DW1]|uniref:geranylgeranylglyceryl/heptaprenylglyceryl phosphate synthase n=2 Tax=Candidatus Nitrosotenuis sp. DW1 TaxID=2259672 RepID=UPI0015CCD8DC|nr:geranylgeranylglyceryl/heptaprenylglyceryl phosphate synthase [Candidatus Nitrosotenuis sp. DW1]QLH09833.1 geranylgeranylglyceryl/heptaprenylglyceryl phosphate synthase [Candidatus Nitrosotenuis sp. DW1]